MMLEDRIKERIGHNIASDDVVLFMKGTPVFPQCGFSAAVVGVLSHLGIKFSGVNVLDDDEIREGIKAYSDWPTIPQLYVKGEFIGGCDIIREMYETGELMEMLNTHGIDVNPSLCRPSRTNHPL
jgi:monothiol glutaredoxin